MVPKWNIHKPQYDSKGHKLDAMAREYPAAEEPLTLDEMLALPPLPRSFRYEIKKDDDEVIRRMKEREDARNRKTKEDLENAKKMLRDLALGEK